MPIHYNLIPNYYRWKPYFGLITMSKFDHLTSNSLITKDIPIGQLQLLN